MTRFTLMIIGIFILAKKNNMNWSADYIEMSKVEFKDTRVYVFSSSSKYVTMNHASDIISACWKNDILEVKVEDGRTFSYEGENRYTTEQ
jgi:hypothetical protein